MGKDKDKNQPDPSKGRKFSKGGPAGRSSGRTVKGEKSSGGPGRDRPMPGYGLTRGQRFPPPGMEPPVAPLENEDDEEDDD